MGLADLFVWFRTHDVSLTMSSSALDGMHREFKWHLLLRLEHSDVLDTGDGVEVGGHVAICKASKRGRRQLAIVFHRP